MTHEEAVAHIDRWYRYGDRDICVTWPVLRAYRDGLQTLSRWVAESPSPDKFRRQFAVYKTARVYAVERRKR